MPLRPPLALAVLAFCLAGCGGARPSPGPDEGGALHDLWAGLDDGFAVVAGREPEACGEAFGTWFTEFGMRGLACAAVARHAPAALVARAGVRPFESGPHLASAEGVVLDLSAARAFGRYDPAFVRWLVENGVPAAGDPAVRALTQPVYDRRLRRLARAYWLTHADMAADGFPTNAPAGVLADYAAFLDGGPVPEGAEGFGPDGTPNGGFSVYAFTEVSEGLLPRLDVPLVNAWEARYELNTAYGFWLRRRADGTLPIWHDGLRRLLAAYDADWLAANG